MLLIGLGIVIWSKKFDLLVNIGRAFVGGLMIVSGLIKANDTLGFAYKLEEYFEPNALDWMLFHPYALEMSVFICVIEILLGIAVIFGGKMKLTSFALLGMMLFFSWLTFFTASCNDAQNLAIEQGYDFDRVCVTDCGCFGDALKGSVGRSLTPWESFAKDGLLLYFVILFFFRFNTVKLNNDKENRLIIPLSLLVVAFFSWVFSWWFALLLAGLMILLCWLILKMNPQRLKVEYAMVGIVSIVSFAFAFYTLTYLPVKDYRAYAVGNYLPDLKTDGVPAIVKNVFIYKNKATGELKEFTQKEYVANWESIEKDFESTGERTSKVLQEGKPASIADFGISTPYNNLSLLELNKSIIKNQIDQKYPQVYEKILVFQNKQYNYIDSILVQDYDPIVYENDSVWVNLGEVARLIDPNKKLIVELNDYIFSEEWIVLVGCLHLDEISETEWKKLNKITKALNSKNIDVIGLSPMVSDVKIDIIKDNKVVMPIYLMDGIELKIVVRSNPGVVLLNKGKVVNKWAAAKLPSMDELFKIIK